MTHYHVVSGQSGCLPYLNETLSTKREAERRARELAREYKDEGEEVQGNDRTGYRWGVDGINYLHVEACADPSLCEEQEAQERENSIDHFYNRYVAEREANG